MGSEHRQTDITIDRYIDGWMFFDFFYFSFLFLFLKFMNVFPFIRFSTDAVHLGLTDG